MTVQVQHVDFYRKVLLRRYLLKHRLPGATYLPFIGDGDLAVDQYVDHQVYGADIDPERIQNCRNRFAGDIRIADCEMWPFPDVSTPFAVADFDAYNNPYRSFHAFWKKAPKADRLVMFFTDGARLALMRGGHWTGPDGGKCHVQVASPAATAAFQFYYSKQVVPWFDDYIRPWKVVYRVRYLRSHMLYWGTVIER